MSSQESHLPKRDPIPWIIVLAALAAGYLTYDFYTDNNAHPLFALYAAMAFGGLPGLIGLGLYSSWKSK